LSLLLVLAFFLPFVLPVVLALAPGLGLRRGGFRRPGFLRRSVTAAGRTRRLLDLGPWLVGILSWIALTGRLLGWSLWLCARHGGRRGGLGWGFLLGGLS